MREPLDGAPLRERLKRAVRDIPVDPSLRVRVRGELERAGRPRMPWIALECIAVAAALAFAAFVFMRG
jgi:hypothetical protein